MLSWPHFSWATLYTSAFQDYFTYLTAQTFKCFQKHTYTDMTLACHVVCVGFGYCCD